MARPVIPARHGPRFLTLTDPRSWNEKWSRGDSNPRPVVKNTGKTSISDGGAAPGAARAAQDTAERRRCQDTTDLIGDAWTRIVRDLAMLLRAQDPRVLDPQNRLDGFIKAVESAGVPEVHTKVFETIKRDHQTYRTSFDDTAQA